MNSDAELERIGKHLLARLRERPELITTYQEIRSAHLVAQLLGPLMQQQKVSIADLSRKTGIGPAFLDDVALATTDKPLAIYLLSKIMQGLGFDTELYLVPSEKLNRAEAQIEEFTGDGNLDGVCIRAHSNSSPNLVSKSTFDALERLGRKQKQKVLREKKKEKSQKMQMIFAKEYEQMATNEELKEPTLSYLLRVADSIDYRIQVRLYEAKKQEPRKSSAAEIIKEHLQKTSPKRIMQPTQPSLPGEHQSTRRISHH